MNRYKKIFLTGSSGGIGKAICEKFINYEFKLVLTSSSSSKLQNLKNQYGSEHYYYEMDLSNVKKLQNSLDIISNEHKDISVIVNNAGKTHDNLIFRMKNDQWADIIQTNLSSNYQIIKSLLPNMLSNRYGKIIGISSIVGTTGNPGQANYVASKSGLVGLYKSIAIEVAKRNINVNIISPGFISTSMTDKLNENQKNNYLSKIPMMKFGSPIDVANLVYFLSTDDSSYITGQNFHINGGMLMV